ncbi:hypothetical protein BA896_000790 [Janthinobacterium lividum]|uniref:Uncharacterized protein n=1 Tax=Janthinobacterium lividum TaxID=29581 RepID=A0A1E8PN79_9BURK|nr:hypothetical protein BA896_000790 [Janthinobacterium lividum]
MTLRLTGKEIFHQRDCLFRMTHMRAMSGGLHFLKITILQMLMQIFTNGKWRNSIVLTLKEQTRLGEIAQVKAIISQEGGFCKTPCNRRIHCTKTRFQLLRQIRLIRVFCDDSRQVACPTGLIAGDHIEQAFNILTLKTTYVIGGIIQITC